MRGIQYDKFAILHMSRQLSCRDMCKFVKRRADKKLI